MQKPNLQTFITVVVEVKQCRKYTNFTYIGFSLWCFKNFIGNHIFDGKAEPEMHPYGFVYQ